MWRLFGLVERQSFDLASALAANLDELQGARLAIS